MGNLRRVFARLRNVIRPYRGDDELDRELAAHLAMLEDEHRRSKRIDGPSSRSAASSGRKPRTATRARSGS
jgi:hypothetical protein